MARPMRAIVGLAAAGALVATTLSGCFLIEGRTTERVMTATEACVTGHTWELDVAALAPVATTTMRSRGYEVDVSVEGTQRLVWDTDFSMRVTTDLRFVGDMPSRPGFQEQFTVSGESSGLAYFSGDVAVPRDWDSQGLTTETTATQDGEPTDIAYPWLPLWIDDTAGLRTTCDDQQLTLTARQGHLAWTFNRVS